MGELRDFVSDVLEIEGSAVEAMEPDGLEVLAPAPLRTAMGWPELVRLGFGAELPAGAVAVGFEGDWLAVSARFFVIEVVGLSDSSRFQAPCRALLIPNGCSITPSIFLMPFGGCMVSRRSGASPAAGIPLHRSLRREREGLVWLGFNQGTGAVIDDILARLRPLLAADTEWQVPDPDVRRAAGPAWDAHTLEARVRPLLKHRVRLKMEPFLRTMRRRLDRDRNRIDEYHNDLWLVAQRKLTSSAGIRAKKRKATASGRCCVSRRSSGNIPLSSTICAAIMRFA